MQVLPDKALRYLYDQAYSVGMEHVCSSVLDNARFKTAYGSQGKHHAYPGGLLTHTAEVLKFAMASATSGAVSADTKIIVPAVIFHDFAKIYDYEPDGTPRKYRTLIRHVAGSYAAWCEVSKAQDIPETLDMAIGHCILAHHGRQEWGSPVEPTTPEAWIIHAADMASCFYGASR